MSSCRGGLTKEQKWLKIMEGVGKLSTDTFNRTCPFFLTVAFFCVLAIIPGFKNLEIIKL